MISCGKSMAENSIRTATEQPTRPTVSVVVPTYQRREYVSRAVASVLAQTYPHFELIVVDDGSTDGTDVALQGLDHRLRYRWQENQGVAAARNAGIAMARGEIVAFLDSDDHWLPNHLAVVVDALARFPSAVLVNTCPGFLIRGRTPVQQARVIDLLPRLLLGNVVGYTPCTAVRSRVLHAAGGFDERLPVYEDSDLWLRLAMHGPFCLLSHRTIVHHSNRDGLKQSGIKAGRYVQAMELSALGARDRLRRLERNDVEELSARSRAKGLLLDVAQALARGDHESAGSGLAAACALAPDLSREPEIILSLLQCLPVEPDEGPRRIATVAELWPDQESDTARYLRGYGAVRALRAHQFTEAAQQFGRARGWLNPAFLVRAAPISARLVRGWLHQKTARAPITRDRRA